MYYFLFSLTLASVFLSTKWSIDSLTGSSDLRCATGFGRATSMPCLALSLSPAQPPGPLKQDRGRVGVYLFVFFILILSHTSICLTIQPVVHGKHHRIERTKRCDTGAGRTASLPCLALSLSPAQPPGPTSRTGAERVCVCF